MKSKSSFILLFSICLIPIPALAQRIEAIDWVTNPHYPVPYIYTSNHLKLSGKVKKLSDMWKAEYGSDIIMIKYEFSRQGELEKQTYSRNNKETRVTTYKDTVYAFMSDGLTVMEESTFNGETTKTEISFYKKLLSSKKIFSGDTKLYQKTFTKYSHNNQGLLTEANRLEMGNDRTKEKYTYNTAGQLTRYENIAEDKATFKEKVNHWKELSYAKQGDLLTVTTWYRFNQGKDYKVTDVYDINGLLIKSTRESDKKEFSYEYSLDKNNNWTKRVQTEKNTETGVQTVTTTYRSLEYY